MPRPTPPERIDEDHQPPTPEPDRMDAGDPAEDEPPTPDPFGRIDEAPKLQMFDAGRADAGDRAEGYRLGSDPGYFYPHDATGGFRLWQRLVTRRGAANRSGAREPSIVEIWFWAMAVFLLTNPFTFVLMGMDPTASMSRDPTTMRRDESSQLLLYAIRFGILAVALASQRWRDLIRGMRRFLPALCFLGWACLSLAWTDSVDTTAHAVVALATLFLIAFLLAIRLTSDQTARATLLAGLVMGVCSVAWAILLPRYGVHQQEDAAQAVHAGAWRGVYLHKNHLGQICAIFATGAVLAGRRVIRSFIVKWGIVALMLFLIIMSRSASALVIAPLSLFIVWMLICLGPIQRIIALSLSAVGTAAGAVGLSMVLAALGRDMTFTGRTKIWALAFDNISVQPVNGYGFMSPTYGNFTYELVRIVGVFDPHNGFVDLTLGLGIVGLVMFLIPVIVAFRHARRLYVRGGRYREGALVLCGLTTSWLISCLTESNVRPLASVAALGYVALGLLLFGAPRRSSSRVIPSVPGEGGAQ